MKIELTTTTPADLAAIKALLDASFKQEKEGRLVEKLFSSTHFIPELSIMAHHDGELVGYILYTVLPIKGPHGEHTSIALAPVAAHPDKQQQGIGKQLIQHSLDKAKQLGYTSVVVLGHAEYYPKFGFKPADSAWGITCPFPVPDNVFMALELVPNALHGVSGQVAYAPEFLEE